MDTMQDALPAKVNSVVTNHQAELDKRVMNALLRKIDLRLIPLITLLLFFCFLDRTNIEHARSFGLQDYLGVSSSNYGWAGSIFYISYGLCSVPSTLLMRRFSPSKWIAIMTFTWGIITILKMFVYNLASLLIARFFLGMAEAGLVPGIIYYLSLWYIPRDQAFRIGIFMSGGVLGYAFDGILAYGIEQIDDRGILTKWQWLCLAEGMSTVCLAIVTFKLLANPANVPWLDQCQKDILTTRLIADAKGMGDTNNESLSHQIRSICLDWKMLFYILIYMGSIMPFYGLNSFLPTIIEDMRHTNATSATTEILTVPPYIVSHVIIIVSSWTAGRLNERSNHIMILLLIAISGFLYLIFADKYLYIGAIIIGTSMVSSNALALSWLTNNIGSQTKRAVAIALIITFGSVGAILSQQIYREVGRDFHTQRHWIMIGILCFTFVLVLSLKLLLKYENKRRRNLTTVQLQDVTVAGERQAVLDKYPDFVYVT